MVEILEELFEKVKTRRAKIGILGLGRVGLPLATVFATSGFQSLGIDNNLDRLNKIQKSICPFYDPSLQENLNDAIKTGNLRVVSNLSDSDYNIDVIFVTVGTPTNPDNTVDYGQLYGALEQISRLNLSGKMVILRSTLPVRTTEEIVIPFLESKTSLVAGKDFAIAVCPERILEGRAVKEIKELPEIIGGVNTMCNNIAAELFLSINSQKEILFTTPPSAELAKLFTNIYRYISFALSNEFAIWAERYQLDAAEIIRIANHNYPRCNIPIPGFAGGPCLSKDGILLDNNTTFSSIVSTAWKINESIPSHIVNNLKQIVGNLFNKKIAVLGLAFKAGSDDLRNSPSVKLVEILKSLGANVMVHDPFVQTTHTLAEVLQNSDIVVLATNHSVFKEKVNDIRSCGCKLIYDVWNMYRKTDFPNCTYVSFGQGLDN